nr:tRNA glutamyl-Q(34) synthetase GluQRS [Propionibacterium sp.]
MNESPGAGRFAPSPTSELHVGNLRTALVAWLMARSTRRRFLVRIEDLDVARVAAAPAVAAGQLRDLAALGLDWDGEVVRQSDRLDRYADALARLPHYECFCTRREIAEAASAPHADGHRPYPGTCRGLSDADRAARRAVRPPALRVDAGVPPPVVTVHDVWAGAVTGEVDDFVLRRNDGAYAYNLAVVVDDLAQGVDQVVRGDDLLSSSPRQAWLAGRLGGRPPEYAHVPLVVNAAGARLAKRDGAVTLGELAAQGLDADGVRSLLGWSLGLNGPDEAVSPGVLLARWDPARLPRARWTFAWPGDRPAG